MTIDQKLKQSTIPILLLVIMAASVHSAPRVRAAAATLGQPDWTPMECPMEVSARFEVDCGLVTVPEDHDDTDGPSIQIAVAVVHSSGDAPAPDPLLFINGGPGARTLDSMALWLETFSAGPILAERDIVFFDQRGTGYSKPALVCPKSPSANPMVTLQDAQAITACRKHLVDSGINLDAYTSAQIAGDIAVLGEALGYERWNLYGVSYGARIALTTLRDRPEGVRSVVLDAITPIEADLLLEDPFHAQEAVQHLFAACRADLVCRTAYPDVEQVYGQLFEEWTASPLSVKVANRKTGDTRTEEVNGATLDGTIIGMLGSPEAAGAPGLVYELRDGTYDPLISSLESSWEAEVAAAEKPIPLGAQLAIICSEEAPFVAPEEMARMLADYPPEVHSRAAVGATLYTACQTWGIGPANPVEDLPVASDVPVLVLAGEFDAVRPLAEARRAAEPLTNSTVVEFPGAGHAVALAGTCPLGVMAQFLDDPTTVPDTGCTARMEGPRFFITIGLTRPFGRAVAVIAGIAGLAVALYGGVELGRMAAGRRIPWRVTLRRVGWMPSVAAVLAMAAVYLIWPLIELDYFWSRSLVQVAIMVGGPLVVAIQTAFFFGTDYVPAREVLLACPRPFHWLAVERTAAALLWQTLIAVAIVAAGAWGLGEELPIASPLAFLWWLSSALALSGLAAFTSARSQRAMAGVLLALLTWLVMGFASSDQFDDVLLPSVPLGFHFGWPRPLDVIQPFLWLFHPFLRPGSVSTADFVLNRIIVGGLGLVLLALAARRLADPERVLLGTAGRSSRTGWRARLRGGRQPGSLPKPLALSARMGDTRLVQLCTIVWYEMLSSWRRGSLRALVAFTLLFPQLFHAISLLFGSLMDEALIASLADRPDVLLLAGTNAALVASGVTMIMIVLPLPLMVSEIIPLDRQHRVREVIDAAPLGKGLYLAGKMLSVWPVVVAGLAVAGVLNGLISWVLNGPFRIEVFAQFWLVGLIPLALFGTQMGVMLAAGRPDRRRAILASLLAIVATFVACLVLPAGQFLAAGTFQLALQMAEIDDPRVIAALPNFPDMLSLGIWLRIGGVVLVMVVVWLCTLWFMRRGRIARSREAIE